MQISLIGIGNPHAEKLEFLGISTIAGYLSEHGHSAQTLVFRASDPVGEVVKNIDPTSRFIGFSMVCSQTEYLYRLIAAVKAAMPEAILYAGGVFATQAAEFVLQDAPELSFVMLGDGEDTTLRVLEYYERTGQLLSDEHIRMRGQPSDPVPAHGPNTQLGVRLNHDILGTPAFEGEYMAGLYASRGCMANCLFCSCNYLTNRPGWHGKPIPELAREVFAVHQRFGIRVFQMHDSTFEDPGALGKQRLAEFCDSVIAYGTPLCIIVSVRSESFTADDLPLLRKMNQAHVWPFVGIESMDPDDLIFFRKRATVDDHMTCLRLFARNHIPYSFGIINFNPYSTARSMARNAQFIARMDAFYSSGYGNRLQVFYGTPLYQLLKERDMLKPEYSYRNYTAYKFNDPLVQTMSDKMDYFASIRSYGEMDGLLQTKCMLFMYIMSLTPDGMEIAREIFGAFGERVRSMNESFFGDLFVGMRFDGFERRAESFNAEMTKLYSDNVDKLYARMDAQPFFRSVLSERKY